MAKSSSELIVKFGSSFLFLPQNSQSKLLQPKLKLNNVAMPNSTHHVIGESLLTSFFTFLLISIRLT